MLRQIPTSFEMIIYSTFVFIVLTTNLCISEGKFRVNLETFPFDGDPY